MEDILNLFSTHSMVFGELATSLANTILQQVFARVKVHFVFVFFLSFSRLCQGCNFGDMNVFSQYQTDLIQLTICSVLLILGWF